MLVWACPYSTCPRRRRHTCSMSVRRMREPWYSTHKYVPTACVEVTEKTRGGGQEDAHIPLVTNANMMMNLGQCSQTPRFPNLLWAAQQETLRGNTSMSVMVGGVVVVRHCYMCTGRFGDHFWQLMLCKSFKSTSANLCNPADPCLPDVAYLQQQNSRMPSLCIKMNLGQLWMNS